MHLSRLRVRLRYCRTGVNPVIIIEWELILFVLHLSVAYKLSSDVHRIGLELSLFACSLS